jgi:hypothetical protein
MSWTYLGQATVKARKAHRCLCCGESIKPGEQYVKRSGVESGEGFMNMLMHPECEKATAGWNDDDWESFSEGTLKRGEAEER